MKKNGYGLLVILVLLMTGCNKKVTTIKITYNLRKVGSNLPAGMESSRFVHYSKNCIMLQMNVPTNSYDGYMDDNGKMVIIPESHKINLAKSFYVFYKGKKKGIMYESLKDSLGKVFSVDSISKFYLYSGINFPSSEYATLKGTVLLDDGKEIVKYAVNNVSKPGDTDSIYYYFDSKLNNINYSFSKELDSIKKMKLYKYVWVSDSLYRNRRNEGEQTIVPREIILEFNPIHVNNREEINLLFNRFKKQFRNL